MLHEEKAWQEDVLAAVNKVIQNRFGTSYEVEDVGMTSWGVYMRESPLELAIIVRNTIYRRLRSHR